VPLRLGKAVFDDDAYVVMAVINRTPDSFFDQGATFKLEAALERVDQVVASGAEIVDIGGVKAGPGEAVEIDEELRRTAPLVAAVRAQYPDLVVSVDTWRAEVAEAAVQAGADLINDTWSAADPNLVRVAGRMDVGLVCSHVGPQQPRTRPHRVAYADVVAEMRDRLLWLAEQAVASGVRRDAILIDPTHDFGKNTRHSLELTRRLDTLVDTGWPVLVSLSRKDFVGETLNQPPQERLYGTLAATAVSAWLGARIFRAHDVAATRDVVDMVASIRGLRPPAVARRGLA
jgi:dihydropteroate synthase